MSTSMNVLEKCFLLLISHLSPPLSSPASPLSHFSPFSHSPLLLPSFLPLLFSSLPLFSVDSKTWQSLAPFLSPHALLTERISLILPLGTRLFVHYSTSPLVAVYDIGMTIFLFCFRSCVAFLLSTRRSPLFFAPDFLGLFDHTPAHIPVIVKNCWHWFGEARISPFPACEFAVLTKDGKSIVLFQDFFYQNVQTVTDVGM